MKIAIVAGSSRNDGDTTKLVQHITNLTRADVYDLNEYQFSYYDYEHLNKGDDFLPLIRKIIEENDTLVFVSPVYWYAMSGIMKVFFDRMSDLLTIEKDLGRKLRGKNMAVITISLGNNLGTDFFLPFIASADYLGMHYLGGHHTHAEEDYLEDLKDFLKVAQLTPKS